MNFDHFGAIAPIYARVSYSKRELMSEIAALPVAGKLLDVGGGTGRVAAALHGLAQEVVVADVSFGMLRQARFAPFRSVHCYSETLPFADDSFERVIMVDALHHVVRQEQTAREMFRVLKPGGVLVIEEPDIRSFGVKLIALGEKLLLMRSKFLAPRQIAELLDAAEKEIRAQDGAAWVVFRKAA